MSPFRFIMASKGIICLLSLSVVASAQDAAEPPAPKQAVVNYQVKPNYPYDPQRLKRRPVIDGSIQPGEWDALYSVGEGPATGSAFVNWDDDYLYIAARTDQPAWVLLDVDGAGDGWLHGADNLELVIGPVTGDSAPTLTARTLDAASNKDAPIWVDNAVDVKSIRYSAKETGDGETIEMAIPRGIASINPRANATLGLRVDFLPAAASPAPTHPYEPHLLLDVRLVDAHVVTAPGVVPRLTLDDNKVIPGQALRATLELTGQTDEEKTVRSASWKGEGPAADLLRTERSPVDGKFDGRHALRLRYSTPIPETAVTGFYQITGLAELGDGNTVSCTSSFSIAEPFQVDVTPDTATFTPLPRKKLKVWVTINSAVPGYAKGDIELNAPAGWVVEGHRRKPFEVMREDSAARVAFFLTVPNSVAAGDYTLNATVYWHKRTWKGHGNVHTEAGSSGAPPPAEGKKGGQ